MSLATEDDLEARLGRSLTDTEISRTAAILEDVSGAVELYTGRKFSSEERTLRTRVSGSFVRLPQRPVTEVASVADIDGNDVGFSFDGIDRVYVGSGGLLDTFDSSFLPRRTQVVDITYTAGPAEVPQPIVGVVANVALRTLGLDPTETAITQESVDGYAFTIGSAGGAGAYGILPAEARILNSFRRVGGTIRVAM